MAEAGSLVLRGNRVASGFATPPRHCKEDRAAESSVSSSCGAAARSQLRLHNFSFPSMSWGTQRLLRCSNLGQRGIVASARSVSTAESAGSVKRRGIEGEEGEAPVREDGSEEGKDKCRQAFGKAVLNPPQLLEPRPGKNEGEHGQSFTAACEDVTKPWNLRLKRAGSSDAPLAAPENGLRKSSKAPGRGQILVASKTRLSSIKCFQRRRRWDETSEEGEKKRPRFSSVLSRNEIEEDFFLMTGSKLPRRPQKRTRNVQKQIDMLFPGFYLTEITPDLYKTS